jgi:hypothetical protein
MGARGRIPGLLHLLTRVCVATAYKIHSARVSK